MCAVEMVAGVSNQDSTTSLGDSKIGFSQGFKNKDLSTLLKHWSNTSLDISILTSSKLKPCG